MKHSVCALVLGWAILCSGSAQAAIDFGQSGKKSDRGNLIGIQPYVIAEDFATAAKLTDKLGTYFDEAAAKGWLSSKTIVVLPEYLGLWLVAADEKTTLYQKETLESAMKSVVFRNPFSFLKAYLGATGSDKMKNALFRMRAVKMAEAYHEVFSTLAKKYGVYVVAGSTVLPDPSIQGGKLKVNKKGSMYNVSVLYRPDGSPDPQVVKKVFPIDEEKKFLSSAKPEDLPVFETPMGRLGVLICADSWHQANYDVLRKKKVDLIAVPAYLDRDDATKSVWNGYNGTSTPADVSPSDLGKLTEQQAWLRYAMAGRIQSAGAAYGITVFLRGHLWDLGSDGAPIVYERGKVDLADRRGDAASIYNVWLEDQKSIVLGQRSVN
jgi:predicted amidohydrolase